MAQVLNFILKNSNNDNGLLENLVIMYYNHITIQKIIVLVYICSIGAIYTLMLDYNSCRMDEGWFASFIYQSYIRGINTDEVFGGDLSNGFGGTQLFGKVYTMLYGSMVFIFQRWDKQFFYLLSSILVFATAMLWW